jgi:hypothetical protein
MIHIEIIENDADNYDVIVNGVYYENKGETPDQAFEWAKRKAESVRRQLEADRANTLKEVFDTFDEIFKIRK